MKKFFTISLMTCFITFANAQRHADIQVTGVNPTGTVKSNSPFNLDCKIKNLGPDDIKASDTINCYLVLGTTIYLSYGKQVLNTTWAVNEEKQISVLTNFSITASFQGPLQICTYGLLFNRSATDSISDLVSSNNAGCNTVTFQWSTGLNNPGNFIMDAISVYPNPVVNETKISYSLNQTSNIRISVKDITGREIMMVENGMQSAGLYEKQVDLSALNPGIYMVEYAAGDKVYTSKLIKN